VSELWQQLLSSAIVGTQRRPCRVAQVDGPLATFVPTGELDAGGILSAAAAITAIRRAARRPRSGAAPVAAPPEVDPEVPPRAAARVGRLIGDLDGLNYRPRLALLQEWLELACGKGLLAPPRHLAALADLATAERELRPLVLATGGARLVWLAGLNPGVWDWVGDAGTEPPADVWLTGTIEARARHLGAARAADAAHGRALLEGVWPQEKAADLAALIAACAHGLTADDEPWLEKALDDRRVQVREAAASLLAVLPGSAYQGRAAERALTRCRLDSQGRVEVVLPEEFDAGMRRDGLSLKPPHGMGEKAWWLLQIVATAPLDCWSTLDKDPVGLLARQTRDDWTGLLRQGWVRAAVRQRSSAWALALTRHATQGNELAELLCALPPQVLRERATEMVRLGDSRIAEALQATPAPWPSELTDAVLAHLHNGTVGRQGYWWALALAAERRLDPAAALPAIRGLLPQSEGRLRDALERLDETLTVRLEMHQEFA
jgi:Family of unknown function (DUF5691)